VKKLINRPERVVEEMIEGLVVLHPGLSRLACYNVLLRSDQEQVKDREVALISGGGSGHEPAHAGYIGPGMLSAAVAGEVFTSPSSASVLAAIHAVTGKPGVLLIVKNYTGDRLNFGLAAEMARASGMLVETVVVADDIALAASENHAGRRGIAGTVLVHKIAGAAAAEGKDLPQVAAIAQAAAENIGTMGVSLSAGISPVTGKASFTLGDEVELGLGIHGEPGIRRIPLRPADELVDELLSGIARGMHIRSGERLVVLLNNLGATTAMELAIVGRRTLAALESWGVVVERFYSGTFMSSLDMAGVSISVLRVDDDRLKLLDAPTSAPAWINVTTPPAPLAERTIEVSDTALPFVNRSPQTDRGVITARAITAACAALLDAESLLTELDRVVGDGDLGINMARASRMIQSRVPTYPLDDPAETFKALGITVQDVLGGSSGPLYGVLLLRMGSALEGSPNYRVEVWATALLDACQAVSELGGAKLGDRTMLDAIIPFSRTLHNETASGQSIRDALIASSVAAERGAEETKRMVARRGRSSYLGERVTGHPDPGAVAAAILLRAVVSAIAG